MTIPALAATLFYLSAFLLQLKHLRENSSINTMTLHGVIMPALCLHLIVLWQTVYSGLYTDLRFYNALSLILFLSCTGIYLARTKLMQLNLLLIFTPLAAVALVLQATFQYPHPVSEGFDWQIQIHIAMAVIAFSVLAIAAAQALALTYQQRSLKTGMEGRFLRWFPPLDHMEKLLFQMIAIGFVLLTLTLLSGILFVEDLFAQSLVHKTILSVIAWFLFGGLLLGHFRFGWRGSRATRLTLIAMAILLLAFLGSKLVLELILQR